jgi:seryl-tRNA synthetase
MIPDNQDSISDIHITTEEKLPPISPPQDQESNTSIISISDQLRKEQKQLDELMAQQNKLLEQAKMFRERVDEKLALHESFKSSRNDSRINNEKTGVDESFLNEISFQSLPKV